MRARSAQDREPLVLGGHTIGKQELLGTREVEEQVRGQCAASRPTGGEQAANALQQDSSNRYALTANAKVKGTITASPLVTRRPYLFHTAVIKGVHVTLFLIVRPLRRHP